MSFIFEWLSDSVWGITTPALETILKIAEREPEIAAKRGALEEIFHKSALSVQPGERIAGTRYAYQRNGVGILPIMGPIFPRANMMTDFSGATSGQMLASDFSAMLNNKDIQAILLEVDSPGGAITGISELASLIYNSRGVKPIHAHISGMGASAAYWIASAADKIIISDTGEAGSIGTVAVYKDTSKADEIAGVKNIEIVSSQSPLKRVSPASDLGREKIQRLVDAATTVFIRAVAEQRGTTEETVAEDFGRGDVFMGVRAVAQGLADEVGTFESTLSALCNTDNKTKKRKGHMMGQENDSQAIVTYTVEGVREGSPETYAAIIALGRKEGAEAERNRITGIQAMAISGCEKLVADAVSNPDMTAEKVAVEIVKAQQAKTVSTVSATTEAARQLAGAAAQIPPVGTGALTEEETKVAERKVIAEGIAAGGTQKRSAVQSIRKQ